MSLGLLFNTGSAVFLAALVAAVAASCDFKPECRQGETYLVAIPCENKCSYYIQCQDGVSSELKCGKSFWRQTSFDPATLKCIRDVDCDWWKKLTTTPAPTTASAPTETPTTTTTTESFVPSTATAEASSTAEPTPTTTSTPSSTAAPASDPTPPPADSAAAPLAAASSILVGALALFL